MFSEHLQNTIVNETKQFRVQKNNEKSSNHTEKTPTNNKPKLNATTNKRY